MRNDGFWGLNGERLEGGRLRSYHTRSREALGASPFMSLGLVVGRHFKDEESNASHTYTEYDIWLVYEQLLVDQVCVLMPYQGVTGGDEVVLHVAPEIPNGTDPSTYMENVMRSDGDIVAVAFVAGREAVIVGCMNHLRPGSDAASWGGTSTDGEIASRTYNDVVAKIDKDGNAVLDLEDTKELIVNINGNQVFRVTRSGAALTLELGSGTLEKVVLGETFQSWWDLNVPAHTHLYNPGAGAPVATAVSTVPTFPAANLTSKVKAER